MTTGNGARVDYTGISNIYDAYRSYSDDLIKRIVGLGQINRGGRVLDLGCGTGNVASQIKCDVDASIVGIDLSLEMLKLAKKKSLDVVCGDIDNQPMPFIDGSFQTVVCAYVIHQIKNLDFVLSECYRVLRAGALVLLTSSHKQIENQHPIIKKFFPSYVDIDKSRFPDIDRIDSILSSLEFKNVIHEEVTVDNIPIDPEYLQKIKNKYVSTYQLMPQNEFENGIAQLEAFIENLTQPEFRDWHGTIISAYKTRN